MKKLILILILNAITLASAIASEEIVCGSTVGRAYNAPDSIANAQVDLHQKLAEWPGVGKIKIYEDNTAIKGLKKKISELTVSTSTYIPGALTHTDYIVYSINGPLTWYTSTICTSLTFEGIECSVRFRENDGSRYAVCPKSK